MADVSNHETSSLREQVADKQPVNPVVVQSDAIAVVNSKWYRWRKDGVVLAKYLFESEVHTYAFSVAANALLSFMPIIVLLYILSLGVFHSQAMANTVDDMVHYFILPPKGGLLPDPKKLDFAANYLRIYALRGNLHHGRVSFFSLFMIIFAGTGIFLPLEVALNQAWGVVKGRNIVMNQVVAFGLTLWVVVLGVGCMMVNTILRAAVGDILGGADSFTMQLFNYLLLVFSTGVAAALLFFSIYWIMPNCKVPAMPVFKVSVVAAAIWVVARLIFALLIPTLDLESTYGPFQISVGLIFLSYTSGLIIFAGAQFSVTRLGIESKKHG